MRFKVRLTTLTQQIYLIKEKRMTHEKYQSCIEACQACAVACYHCASACLQEQDVQKLAKCIALDMECGDICSLAVKMMASSAQFSAEFCKLCADVCKACGDECANHKDMEHCQQCKEACYRCEKECRKMASNA